MDPTAATARFVDRVAIVTGAGSGIGERVAERFAREGGRVVLVGRSRGKLERVAARLPQGTARIVDGAHEDPDCAARAVRAALESFSSIDVLVANAGTYDAAPIAECSDLLWRGAMERNLTGPFVFARAALPALRERRGAIVTVASTLAIQAIPGTAPYAVAKAGLVALTRILAHEEAAAGVRANVVCPGVVDTPIHADRDVGAFAALHPLGRVGTPDEVADAVLFLASPASGWTTGAVLTVDGGIALT